MAFGRRDSRSGVRPSRAWAAGRGRAHLSRLSPGTPVSILQVVDDEGVTRKNLSGTYIGQVFDRPTGRIRLKKYDPLFLKQRINDEDGIIELEILAENFQRQSLWSTT